MKDGHGGDVKALRERAGRDVLDFSASINPLGPPAWLRDVISANVSSLVDYPDPSCSDFVAAVAAKRGVKTTEVLAGNGSSELISLLPRAVGARRAVVPSPAYMEYEAAALSAGLEVVKVPMSESSGFAPDMAAISDVLLDGDIVFIGRPVNPSGAMCGAGEIAELAARHPGCFFAVDEAFLEFADGAESVAGCGMSNVAALYSFTKMFAVPGLRLGAVAACEDIIAKMRTFQPGWSVNTLAQAVGVRAVGDTGYIEATRKYVAEQRQLLSNALSSLPGLRVFTSAANYLLVKIEEGKIDAASLAKKLLKDGIAIRTCSNFHGLDGKYFRVAVKRGEENERLVDAVGAALGAKVNRVAVKRSTPAVMFQATGSNAGKSVVAAGVCRVMLQDGVRVAPFKAQNMSLNSYVARDGGEMGRAQAVQAQACRLDPESRMNPVLLKPNSETGSQVIVDGKPVGNMNVHEYMKYKPEAFERVKAAYDSLAGEFDAIVIEGAGSPAEINLKSHDIVNMAMAKYAGSPVYIIGDIDRGGVFASFVGTFELLEEWEQEATAGFIINKFRGSEALLKDALDYTLARTGRPVTGVLPFVDKLGLPEEDSVSFKRGDFDAAAPGDGCVEAAVIDLPHISNFTDFDALRMEPDVWVRTVRDVREIGSPDVVILPGSKNVMSDARYLKESGIGARIAELAAAGVEVVGICAGMQLLGERIEDPHGIESSSRAGVPGLGLLPISNVLEVEKTLVRAEGVHAASGLRVFGYEIHHGAMSGNCPAAVVRSDGAPLGASAGNVWGTYMHGVFDADEFRRWFIDMLRVRKGLEAVGRVCAVYDIEPALDRLADIIRARMDMDGIYRAMGLR